MKKVITLLFVFMGLSIFSQTPESFRYQAVVRDVSGTLLNNQTVGLRISIMENSVSGSSVYTETFNLSTNDYGLANLSIGAGSVQSGVFASIDWGSTTHYIQVELDAAGGSNYQLVGTSQLLSVPYALYAKNVENDQVDDADNDPSNENQTLSISGSDITISNGNTVVLPGATNSVLNDLGGVNAISPQTNDILMWNGTEWIAGDICSLFSFYYLDSDNDGFGDSESFIYTCSAPNGYVSDSTDCIDDNPNAYPNATELCDNVDNNCDGQVDEGLIYNTYYLDADIDGYGDPNNSILSCSLPVGYVSDGTDCDDSDPAKYLGAPCDDGFFCTTGEQIDANCNCVGIPDDAACDDGNPNTDNICDPVNGCVFPCNMGAPCDDGNPCTENDTVVSGCACQGTPKDCDDGDPLTTDSCNPMTGNCEHTP